MLLVNGLSVVAQETNLYAIANVKGAPDKMNLSDLKSVFKGQRQRWGNEKVQIVCMKTTTTIGTIVSKKIYDMSPDEVRYFWLSSEFSDKIGTLKTCNTEKELESYIAENPGAIGISDRSPDNASIKTIIIDGKKAF